MYPVSLEYKDKIQQNNRVFKANIAISHSQGTLALSNKDIVSGSLIVNESTQSGNDFTIGGTVGSDLSLEILNKPEYDNYDFVGATIIVNIGLELKSGLGLTYNQLKDYTYEELKQYTYGDIGGVFEYVPLGVFNIDDVGKQRNTIKIKAIDNMIKFDKPYSLSSLTYPATLYQIYVDACDVCDVQVGTVSFANMDYIVTDKPADDTTFRAIIGYIAELGGCFAKCNRNGALEIRWYKDSGLTISGTNRYNFVPRDDTVQIKGIMVNVDDTTYLTGTDDYAVDLSDNPLLTGDYETILPNILDKVGGTTFTPYESSWQGNPAIEAGDMITQIDKYGKEYKTLVTHSTYKYLGAGTLSAQGLPVIAKGYKGSTDRKIANIIRKEIKPIGNQLTTLEQAQLNATQLIANMLGGYAIQDGDAFYVADNEDLSLAQKVWKWGIGGFGYSSTGVNGPYNTAITADGSIVAMLVAANIVTADMVRTGILQSEDGSSHINLDDGSFDFKGLIKYDNGKLVLSGVDKLTKITSEGIYTGNISADQITAGTISADRISGGTLSGDYIRGGTISGVKINITDDCIVGNNLWIGGTSGVGIRRTSARWWMQSGTYGTVMEFYSNAVWIGSPSFAVDIKGEFFVNNKAEFNNYLYADSYFLHRGSYLGFFNHSASAKTSISNLSSSATPEQTRLKLIDLINALQSYGLV